MNELEIRHASKSLKGSMVLQDINMKLQSGNIYGLRGVNGAGKTMLMRLMCGLIHASEGEVLWNGKRIGKEISFPDKTGIFLEKPSLLERYSGKRNLELLAEIKEDVGKEEVEQILKDIELWEVRDKKYKKYSLGMKQRLGIGAALLGKPSLLLLDEPMNAIDEKGVDKFKQLFSREKDRGSLIVIASHDSAFLEYICDKIFVLEEGRIVSEI